MPYIVTNCGDTVYENGNYKVVTAGDGFGYLLVNKLTEVVEGKVEKLPYAVAAARAADELMFAIIHEEGEHEDLHFERE